MTVAELIAVLQEYPPDWPVYVRGYEAGSNDADVVEAAHFTRDQSNAYWAGQHKRSSARLLFPNGVEILGRNKLSDRGDYSHD